MAIVTGASSGIGRATATRLAAGGARVVLVARRENRLEGDRESHPRGLRSASCPDPGRFGQFDILVQAAGILVPGTLESTTASVWDGTLNGTLNVNLRTAFLVMPAAAWCAFGKYA